jgi:amidohydrolase
MNYSDIRHDLHNHPGVSGEEHYAHDLIAHQLPLYHPDKVFHHVGGYGIIAVWGTNPSHPTIAIRGDIDALPIGHRCGHDGHTTILLQLAEYIAQRGYPDGRNVLLIFQPEEETGLGAQKIIDAQILQQYNIRAIYGLHNLPGFPLGTVILNRHTFAAASTGIIYRLTGRATHASTPEKGINPGLAIAEIIQQFNRFNSDPNALGDDFRQATLICIRHGEEAFGTSAGNADIMFTLRAFTNDTMEHFIADANSTVAQIASRHHLQLQQALIEPFRATENDSLHVEHIEEVCGCRSQYVLTPFRWSEDFANYLQLYKGAMFGIGAGTDHHELHHPDYDFPDELIPLAAQVFFNLVNAQLI